MDLIGFLLALLVFLVVVYALKVAADYAEVTPPIRNVVLLVAFLVFVIYCLRLSGLAHL